MAYTTSIPLGPPITLAANVAYALPAQVCLVTSSGAVETSLDGTTWTAFTSGGLAGGVFIRSGAAGTIVTCK